MLERLSEAGSGRQLDVKQTGGAVSHDKTYFQPCPKENDHYQKMDRILLEKNWTLKIAS